MKSYKAFLIGEKNKEQALIIEAFILDAAQKIVKTICFLAPGSCQAIPLYLSKNTEEGDLLRLAMDNAVNEIARRENLHGIRKEVELQEFGDIFLSFTQSLCKTEDLKRDIFRLIPPKSV